MRHGGELALVEARQGRSTMAVTGITISPGRAKRGTSVRRTSWTEAQPTVSGTASSVW